FQHTLKLDSIEPNGSSGKIVLSRDSSLLGSNTMINAGILSFNGNRQPFVGTYRSVITTFNQGDSVLRYLNAEGYILGDGSSHFRLAPLDPNPVFYQLEGTLVDSIYFNGTLNPNQESHLPVVLDTLPGGYKFHYDETT